MNLDPYFERISYQGPRTPTLEVLRDIMLAHACAIPFENLDVLLGRGISLTDEDIDRKLITDRRGGYCFEQNSLLARVLTTLGFSLQRLSARVRLNLPRAVTPPRVHLFLRVNISNVPWLVDVGIGGLSPTGPFRLDLLDVEQPTPHEPRRILWEENSPLHRYFHQAKLLDQWVDIDEFTQEEMPHIDCEVGNCWTSTHPKSKFRLNLIVGLARPDGTRLSLWNREFTHRHGARILERFDITDPEELRILLGERFGLQFPVGTRFGPPGQDWPT